METEIINAINLLLREGYLLKTGGILTSTLKLRAFESSHIQSVIPTSVVKDSPRMTIQEFREKAEIPSQIKTKDFAFNANRVSIGAEKAFNKLIGSVDVEKLIAATKAYYANTRIARTTLSNYFMEGIWESVYRDFVKASEVGNKEWTGDRII